MIRGEKNILKLILEDKNANVDRQGTKPLIVFAEEIAASDNYSVKAKVVDELIKLNIDNFSIEELNAFVAFIQYSKIESQELTDKILKTLTTEFKAADDLIKRGLLIRFVSEYSKDSIDIRELLAETSLRKAHPWFWIDTVANYNWEIASAEIATQLTKPDSLKNLILRIPSFIKTIPKKDLEQSLKTWHSSLQDVRDRQTLLKWTQILKIKIGISLDAQVLLDSVPLSQKPVIE